MSLTSLPDHLLRVIISLLPMADLLRLSCTSKKFHLLCSSTPCLVIYDLPPRGFFLRNEIFWRTIDRYFARRGEQPLHSLTLRRRLYRCSLDDEKSNSSIHNCLTIACRCGLQELKVEFDHNGVRSSATCSLPRCVYQCQTLKSYSHYCYSYPDHLTYKYPFSTPFTNLEYLTLYGFKFEDSRLGQWISACPTIKKIRLEKVDGLTSIEINSRSLQSFVIDDPSILLSNLSISGQFVETIHVYNFFSPSIGSSLKIDAPNLKRFIWTGVMTSNVVLEKLVHLQVVHLILAPNKNCHDMYTLLYCTSMAKEIRISSYVTWAFHERGWTIPSFHSHSHSLYLYNELDTYPICGSGIVSLLTRMDKVESLVLLRSNYFSCHYIHIQGSRERHICSIFREKDTSSPMDFMPQLKKVEMEITRGKLEMELAKYLLKHAKQMEEMIIFCSPDASLEVIDGIEIFKEGIYSNAASSCKVKVYFSHRNWS